MTKHTREKWEQRVREWRASGQSAEDFASDKDFEAASLRWAASQVGGPARSRASAGAGAAPSVRRRAVRSPEPAAISARQAPGILPVRVVSTASPASGSEVVVEVHGARIRVSRGADMGLLGEVVRALHGATR
jgi:transposase